MQGLSAPVWEQTQTDPLPCARGLNLLCKFYETLVHSLITTYLLNVKIVFKSSGPFHVK